MGWFSGYVGEILTDMFDTLKAFFCWLMNEVCDMIIDVIVWGIGLLPHSTVDYAQVQDFANQVYMWNELLPVVEVASFYGMYYSFRITWTAFRWVIMALPGIG